MNYYQKNMNIERGLKILSDEEFMNTMYGCSEDFEIFKTIYTEVDTYTSRVCVILKNKITKEYYAGYYEKGLGKYGEDLFNDYVLYPLEYKIEASYVFRQDGKVKFVEVLHERIF